MDGTLVDSEQQNAASIARVLATVGRKLTSEEADYVVGHGWQDIYHRLSRRGPLPLAYPELVRRAADARAEIVAEEGLIVLPGAHRIIAHYAGRLPLALVSGSSRREISMCLELLGIAQCFDCIVASDDIQHGKPSPEGYLRAAALLAVPAENFIVIEDSTAGIQAAKQAKMRCIAVRAGNFLGVDQSAADIIVDTLDEIIDKSLAD